MGSGCQRPLLEDLWGTLGSLTTVLRPVPFESGLTFKAGGETSPIWEGLTRF